MQPILEVKNLKRIYSSLIAVNDISFSVRPGEVVGLLGPNGAGKTTTINMILGILEPTTGTINVLGHDLKKEREKALQNINFAAVYAQLPGNLTVKQNLTIFGLLYGVKNPRVKVQNLIQEFNLERFANSKSGILSSGEQTRLNLAKAMLNDPRLILLDEPTASLDPSTSHLMRDKIREYAHANGAGVLWTSHNMHEVEAVCDRVLFISHGKIMLEGDPKKLPAENDKKNLEELFISIAREPLSLNLE